MYIPTKSKMRYDAGDNEFIPNPIDFIPVDPNDNHQLNDGFPHSEKLKTALCVVCQIIFIILALVLLAVVYIMYSDVNIKQQQPVDYYLEPFKAAPLPKEYFKLKQQCDRMYGETALLKGQFLDFTRWRKNLSKDVQTKIESALELYDADKIGAIDFALETDGGFVVSTPHTNPYEISVNRFVMGLINIRQFSDPQFLLQPGILPGQCFAFERSEGRIRIKLTRTIIITGVTLEHVNKNLVQDIGSAPKSFEVIVKLLGLRNENDEEGRVLGQFTYKIGGKVLQTFGILQSNESYRHVELHILSNYGNEKYTCVYRFRVHGIPVD